MEPPTNTATPAATPAAAPATPVTPAVTPPADTTPAAAPVVPVAPPVDHLAIATATAQATAQAMQQQQPAPQLSPEQVAINNKVWNPSDDFTASAKAIFQNPESTGDDFKKVLIAMRDGIIEQSGQATSNSMQNLQQQFAPTQQAVQVQQADAAWGTFSSGHPELAKHRPYVESIATAMMANGMPIGSTPQSLQAALAAQAYSSLGIAPPAAVTPATGLTTTPIAGAQAQAAVPAAKSTSPTSPVGQWKS